MLVIYLFLLPVVYSQWSGDELAMYDLVEDLNVNFYEFFGIKQDATMAEIKKAYRKMSLEWHPDRNSAPEATETFRKIVSVYEIMKSSELREKYNNVLEFGLPDWRQPIYYYRKMRKFTWYEALLVLLSLSTLTHYLMMWASYYEKRLVLTQKARPTSLKKKKTENTEDMDSLVSKALEEYKPVLIELLPFLIVRGSKNLFLGLMEEAQHRMTAKVEEEEVEEEEEEVESRRRTAPRVDFQFEMAKDVKAVSTNHPELEEKFKQETNEIAAKQSGVGWSFEELTLLIKLSKEKFPPGTPSRWELMARALNRTPEDVTAMSAKVKNMKQEEYAKLTKGQQTEAVNESSQSTAKSEKEWSQQDQKLFEQALQQYPKGTEERWERIAEMVPNRTKEQCMARFKQLVESIKKKKLQNS